MKLESAANMAANRRRILITDRTRRSFWDAAQRMEIRSAAERATAKCLKAGGHQFMGNAFCQKCGIQNPAILVLPETEAA